MNRIMKKAALLAVGICLILSSAAGTVFFGPAQEAQAKTVLHKIPAKGKTSKTKKEDVRDSQTEIKEQLYTKRNRPLNKQISTFKWHS